MGKLKQLLPYRGRTLVEHCVQQAREAGFAPVIVVIGAEPESVRASLAALPVEIVQNDEWESGMGSSLMAGMRRVEEIGSDSAAVAILVADQPLVTTHHLSRMRTQLHIGKAPIIAAQYSGALGVPALFKRELFTVLASLPPHAGARHLLRDSGVEVTPFPLPEAAIDIDTPDDLAALNAKSPATS